MPVTPEVVEDQGNYSKVAAGQWRTIKFAVSLDRSCDPAFRQADQEASPPPTGSLLSRHAATLRDGGAMNSGPTGSVMVSRKIRSISALAEVSSDQPTTPSTGCSGGGWRAPHSA